MAGECVSGGSFLPELSLVTHDKLIPHQDAVNGRCLGTRQAQWHAHSDLA